jgi:hypothetical protein
MQRGQSDGRIRSKLSIVLREISWIPLESYCSVDISFYPIKHIILFYLSQVDTVRLDIDDIAGQSRFEDGTFRLSRSGVEVLARPGTAMSARAAASEHR